MAHTLQAGNTDALEEVAEHKKQNRRALIQTRVWIYIVSAIILLLQFFPLLWALLTSLMTPQETTSIPATLLPAQPGADNYIAALQGSIGHYYVNSIIVSTIAGILTMIIATLAAYAFARLRFRFKTPLLVFVLFFSLFPPLVQVIPVYLMLQGLHLIGTLGALIIPYTVFGLPLAVLILMAFFQDVPLELEEAAVVDGMSRFRAFISIVLPLVMPGLFATGVIVFVGNWNEYLFALNYTTTNTYTLPVGIVTISQTEFTTNFGILSAATVMSIVPLVILILLLERQIISGLTAGSLKG